MGPVPRLTSFAEDSKSTSGGVLCIYGSRAGCARSKLLSRSVLQSQTISMDAGLRMDWVACS